MFFKLKSICVSCEHKNILIVYYFTEVFLNGVLKKTFCMVKYQDDITKAAVCPHFNDLKWKYSRTSLIQISFTLIFS